MRDETTQYKMKPEEGPWVSLPSKQYPDEVYYFNVSTGMSSWEKPESYCEPVDDCTNLQCLAKPSTPERTETCSYIVESLSPNTSPKKRQNASKPASESPPKKRSENKNESSLQRNRSEIKVQQFSQNYNIKRTLMRNVNEGKQRFSERNLKSDSCRSVMKSSKSIMRGDTPYAIAVDGRFQGSDNKKADLNIARQKSFYLEQYGSKISHGKMMEHDKCRGSQIEGLFREREELKARCKISNDTEVYGCASQRMEQLKTKLCEERIKKRFQSDWPENSSEKELPIRLLKQRNSVGGELRHSGISSYFSSSSIARKNYLSDSGNEAFKVRHVDTFLKTHSSPKPVSSQLHLPEECRKSYFCRDYGHSKDCAGNMLSKMKYCEPMSKVLPGDQLKVQSSLFLKKSNSKLGSEGFYGSSEFDTKIISSSYFPDSSSQPSTSNLLQKYVFPDKECKRTCIDKNKDYLPQTERNLFLKPEINTLSRTKTIDHLARYHQVSPGEQIGSVKSRAHSLESGRSLISDPHVLKTPAMDRLRRYKLMLLQAGALRNQHPGDYSYSPKLKYSNIGSFPCASNALSSGRKCNESSRGIRTDNSYEVDQRKRTGSSSYDVPSNYSLPLRNHSKDAATDWKSGEMSSWEWSSGAFVRDYNHKRIADYSKQNTNIATDNMSCVYKDSTASNNVEAEPANERHMKGRISKPDRSSTLSNKYSRYDIPTCYPERLRKNMEILPSSGNNIIQAACIMEKSFEHSESEYENRLKHATSSKVDLETDCRVSRINPNSSKHDKNNSHSEKLSQKVLKPKPHDSKGGITKMNRRVQKQLRTAAPKLMHLPSVYARKKSSLQSEILDQNCKSTGVITGDEEEEMDWEPIEPDKVVLHVEALRKEGGFQNAVSTELVNLCNMDTEVLSQWFVVLDTNVLLSHLAFLRDLRDINDNELGMPTLFIPWIVLQELDNLKSSNRKIALQNYARKAVNFLYDNLSIRHPRVRGQPKAEADEYDSLEPDDSILQCSLNLQKHSTKVLLLTNDHNLFNKAVVNGVECCSAAKLLLELDSRRKLSNTSSTSSNIDDTKVPFHAVVQTIKQCIGIVLEEVLRTEMVLSYDRQWSIVVARKPPWTLNDILFCLLKHWVAVFHLVLPSAARELIEKIRTFVNNEMYETSIESVENLVKTCTSLMHLVSSLSYKQYVDDALKSLNEVQRSLREQTKLSVSRPIKNILAVTGKVNDTLSSISDNSQFGASDSTSVFSKGEQHVQTIGSGVINSGEEDIGNNQPLDGCIERREVLAHKYLNKIWEKVAVYCGMLCDVMGVEPCVPYQSPEPFPALEILHQNVLSFVKCVRTLLQCMEGILSCSPNELQENSPVLLNFYTTIKESLPTWNELGGTLLPQHVLVYCVKTDTRQELERGKKQFEQFEAVLNQAVTFFLGQNQSNTPLPSF